MEKRYIEQLNPGMILARTVYLADGRILCRKMTEITNAAINKFKELRLPAVYIASIPEDNTTVDVVSDITRSEAMQVLAKLNSDLRTTQTVSLAPSKKILTALIAEVNEHQASLPEINDIRILTDYVYSHSVDVCIIAVKMGITLGFDTSKLLELAFAAFLHDIGMTRISPDILGRVGGLTPEELGVIRTHPKIGYDILNPLIDLPKNVIQAIYQHHERFNGSGYPKGIKGAEINELARIIMVADVFDAMAAEKLYRKAKPVQEIIEYIKSLNGIEFDPAVVKALLKIYGKS